MALDPSKPERLTLVEALRHHAAMMLAPEVPPLVRVTLMDAAVLMNDAADALSTQSEKEPINEPLVSKIAGFYSLRKNWDSYGAERFSERTIKLAKEVAAKLGPEWSAVPCADGPSVWLTRDKENDILEVRSSDE